MRADERLALGLDFGTESVRALLVDLSGRERGSTIARYPHGQITERLPTSGEPLPTDFALQHPNDWLKAATRAVRQALKLADSDGADVIAMGVDFTSCTMLPALRDGTPLCQVAGFEQETQAWPKLWKHHGAKSQTARINAIARQRNESWLARYGGTIGLEWFFPKVLETLECSPRTYRAAEVWLEAGDWFVWQLVGGSIHDVPRSTCQAGYKAMWNATSGFPSADFFTAVSPELGSSIFLKLPGRFVPPGEKAGELCPALANQLGLPAGIAVSAAVIDAHAGVPGAGVADADTLVMVLGTSSCHMLNSHVEQLVPGVAGIVADGILPGFFGYETGQAAVGDCFDWLRRLVGAKDFARLDAQAALLPPGSDGVLAIDWLNGCRTPLMDGALTGAFTGLKLGHGPAHLYRAMIEATACGLRWIVELLIEHGVPVRRFVATGGLPHHNPLLMQIYADLLGKPIEIPSAKQGPALGAAILGVLAAGAKQSGFRSTAAAVRAMTGPTRAKDSQRMLRVVRPRSAHKQSYDNLYRDYRQLATYLQSAIVR